MRSISHCLLLAAISSLAIAAKADPVSFTLSLAGSSGPSRQAAFSLPQPAVPDFYAASLGWYSMQFFDIPVLNTNPDGSTFTDLETITFLGSDGDVITNLIHIRTETFLFSGSPANPTFLLGTYLDLNRADGSDVVINGADTPEPQTLALLGTGTLALIVLARRKSELKARARTPFIA